MEHTQRGAGRPKLSREMRDQLTEAFVTATTTAMGQWAGTEVIAREVTQTVPPEVPGTTHAVIDLAGECLSLLVMSFPLPTGPALAKRALREVSHEPDPNLVNDCLGEVANIVAGQAKALLAGTPLHFTLTPPRCVVGGWAEAVRTTAADCVVIAFDCDLGAFSVAVFSKSE